MPISMLAAVSRRLRSFWLIAFRGPRSQLTDEIFLVSGNLPWTHLIVPGQVSFGVMARVPQKYGLPWPNVDVPPPPSMVKILYCDCPGSIAPRSSTYDASIAGTFANPSSLTACTPACGSPDLWSLKMMLKLGPPRARTCRAATFDPLDIVRPKKAPGPVKASTLPRLYYSPLAANFGSMGPRKSL